MQTSFATDELARLHQRAIEVLRMNDLGGWTKASPNLYPHQWSWDAAFIAIGLSHVDLSRALTELETLFEAQWNDGRVPHIVFNPEAADYFPGPDRWQTQKLSPLASAKRETSGIIQPPVHGVALWIIADRIHREKRTDLSSRLAALYQKVFKWHEYLATARDPEKSGLISIYHPWESGTDNSPRWDEPLSRVKSAWCHHTNVATPSTLPTYLSDRPKRNTIASSGLLKH